MLTLKTTTLADRALLIGQIVKMETFWQTDKYAHALRRLAGNGAWFTTAMDRHHLIGCMTTIEATKYTFPVLHREVIEAATGAPLEQCVIRSTVHIRPDHKGQGISRILEQRVRDDTLARGFTHTVAFGYATDEVASWFASRPGAIILDLKDSRNMPVVVEAF
jgi:GNAT superfamily N-acetyltransferase